MDALRQAEYATDLRNYTSVTNEYNLKPIMHAFRNIQEVNIPGGTSVGFVLAEGSVGIYSNNSVINSGTITGRIVHKFDIKAPYDKAVKSVRGALHGKILSEVDLKSTPEYDGHVFVTDVRLDDDAIFAFVRKYIADKNARSDYGIAVRAGGFISIGGLSPEDISTYGDALIRFIDPFSLLHIIMNGLRRLHIGKMTVTPAMSNVPQEFNPSLTEISWDEYGIVLTFKNDAGTCVSIPAYELKWTGINLYPSSYFRLKGILFRTYEEVDKDCSLNDFFMDAIG